MYTNRLQRKALILTAVTTLFTASANALVVVPSSSVATTPSDALLARWGGNASGVVISSEHILTTRHQSGGIGSTVNVDGTNYTVAEITVIMDPDTPSNDLDLRVVRLETLGGSAANFTEIAGIYTGTDETGETLVLGGFGQGRGSVIMSGPSTIGYNSDGVEGTLRWGANTITTTTDDSDIGAYTNDTIRAIFSEPGTGDAEDGEATISFGDSGGGWFYFDGSDWQVAGLSQAVATPNEALYGEELIGVRLSSYATQINNAIPEPSSALLFMGALAGLAMRRRR